MGMSSSQPQPITQGTMGSPRGSVGAPSSQPHWNADPSFDSFIQGTKSFLGGGQPQPAPPTKNYGPVGGMVSSAQNQVNPQTPQILTQTVPNPTAPQQPSNPGFMPMGNPGFMPMGNAGFMPMGNHNFMPMGFGQMPTFGGPRGGKAPQGGGNPPQAMGGDPYLMGGNPNTGRQVRAGYQGGPQTVAYQKQATDNYDGFYSVPYAYDPSIAASDYGKIGAGNLGASAGFA